MSGWRLPKGFRSKVSKLENVGAGLLGNAGGQLKYLWLTPRIRLIWRRGTVSQSLNSFVRLLEERGLALTP